MVWLKWILQQNLILVCEVNYTITTPFNSVDQSEKDKWTKMGGFTAS